MPVEIAAKDTVTMEFADVKRTFMDSMEKGDYAGPKGRGGPMGRKFRSWNYEPDQHDRFIGASPNETMGWLKTGFFSPAFTLKAPDAPSARKRNRARYTEDDGDLDIGRVLDREDRIFLKRGKVERSQGLSIEVIMCFSARVKAPVLAEYGAWVTSLIRSYEERGYDLEVAVASHSRGLRASAFDKTESARIVVKRPNEINDFTSWSVLFAPSGFRTLVFTALAMCAEQLGDEAAGHLGSPLNATGWSVTQEGDKVTICSYSSESDPANVKRELDRSAKEAGIL